MTAKPKFFTRLMNLSLASVLRKVRNRDLRRIPRVTPQEILNNRPIIRVDGSYFNVDGSPQLSDAVVLLSVVLDRAPKSVVEIGTLHGHTTRLLAINLPNAEIHTIDLPEDPASLPTVLPKDDFHLIRSRQLGREYRSDPSIKNVTQHVGDTATLPFPNAELFFIDGSHTYEYVKNDTEKAMAMSQAKTFIWHDCDPYHPGVTKWLRELTDRGLPVKRVIGTSLAVLYR